MKKYKSEQRQEKKSREEKLWIVFILCSLSIYSRQFITLFSFFLIFIFYNLRSLSDIAPFEHSWTDHNLFTVNILECICFFFYLSIIGK